MERPNIEDYENNLNGKKGMALAKYMSHCNIKPLLDYIKYLESRG
jgi:hypothetical protein